MSELILSSLCKNYAKAEAVKDLDLEIRDGEFLVLIGPSGCGKTTTLRMIAGLEPVTSGDIYMGGKRINDVPAKDRDMAMVFQDYALYPHMSVFDNIAFGLKMRGTPKTEIAKRVGGCAEMLGITELLRRKPHALSGGERQRVALGRAIVRQPKVFLFDEPLSNLDAALRLQMREELLQLHKELNTTFVYVTHDQIEAMTMADSIVIMDKGVVQQRGTPDEVYSSPVNRFTALFIGNPQMNILPCMLAMENGALYCYLGPDKLRIPEETGRELLKKYAVGRPLLMGARPEHIRVLAADEGFSARIHHRENTGADSYLYLTPENSEQKIVARTESGKAYTNGLVIGVMPDWERLNFFDAQTGTLL